MWAWWIACAADPQVVPAPPEPTPGEPWGTGGSGGGAGGVGGVGGSGGTGPTDTGEEPTDTGYIEVDCDALPEPLFLGKLDIQPEEDFDFDSEGFLVYQDFSNLAGTDRDGRTRIIASNVAMDPSGVQVTHTGDIVVGAQDVGALKLVDKDTGLGTTFLGGLTQPNGIEIGENDRVYFTEFTIGGRVRWIDPETGLQGTIMEGTDMPNGLVLSLDEQKLYVGGQLGGDAAIMEFARLDDDVWDPISKALFVGGPTSDFDAVEVDECGNVYTVEYNDGRVLRVSPDGSTVTELMTIDSAGFNEFNSLRWGNGVGGWRRDTLYVTNRIWVWEIRLFVKGKSHPVSP
jgi:sugar lactone lactonase YvrE